MKVKNFYNCLFIIINLLILNSCKENSLLFKDTFRTNKNGWDTLTSKEINFYKQKIQKYKKKEKNSFSIVTDKSSIQFLLNDKIVTTISKRNDLGIYFGYLVLNSSISVDNLEVKKH